jgi:hypothetical protein
MTSSVRTRLANFDPNAQPQFAIGAAGLEPVQSFRQLLWNELKAGHIKVDTSNMTHAVLAMKALHPHRLQEALALLVARHPVLGGRIEDRSGEPWLHSDPTNVASLEIVQASTLEEAEVLVSERIWRAFAPAAGPLHRAIAVKLEAGTCFIALVVHHFVVDGFSINVLANDFVQIYTALAQGRVRGTTTQILSYPDYIHAINHWSRGENAQRYIGNILDLYSEIGVVNITGNSVNHVGEDRFEIEASTAHGIRNMAKGLHVTPFVLLLASQFALLQPFSDKTRIGIKAVTTGRELPILMPVIGNLANRMLVTLDLAGSGSFLDIIQRTTTALNQSRQTSFVRDDFVQSKLIDLGLSRPTPMFNFVSNPVPANRPEQTKVTQRLQVIQQKLCETTRPRDHYFLFVVDDGETFKCKAQYAADCIVPLPSILDCLLTRVIQSPSATIWPFVREAWDL